MRAHQPGSTPIDIPETVPNPAYPPAPTPAPAPERAPTKVPEKVGHRGPYSNTSSARPISVLGMVRPSALAVFRLMYSSTLVACCTGRSAGFSPLRTRPV